MPKQITYIKSSVSPAGTTLYDMTIKETALEQTIKEELAIALDFEKPMATFKGTTMYIGYEHSVITIQKRGKHVLVVLMQIEPAIMNVLEERVEKVLE